MVKTGTFKHGGKITVDVAKGRGGRHADRLKAKLHQKNLKGTHFIRIASLDDISEETDKRFYLDENEQPYTLESAMFAYDVFFQMC